MDNYKLMNFKVKEVDAIKMNLKAFCGNFNKGITIQKYGKYYYIFDGIMEDDDILYDVNWVFSCDSLDVINGWLYGMVQANNGFMELFEKVSDR